MEFDRRTRHAAPGTEATHSAAVPGKRTLTEAMVQHQPVDAPRSESASAPDAAPAPATSGPRPSLQRLFGDRRATAQTDHVHAAAARGTATAATQLPHLAQIQRSFGHHDVGGVKAHIGAEATASARDMGAHAYATADHVVLGDKADLHTEAHEAAHVVQQRGGVQLKGGVGEVGDTYERHADAVADAVVRGESAEALLDLHQPQGPGGAPATQRQASSAPPPAGGADRLGDVIAKLQALVAEPTLDDPEADAKRTQLSMDLAQLRQLAAGSNDALKGEVAGQITAGLADAGHDLPITAAPATAASVQRAPVQREGGSQGVVKVAEDHPYVATAVVAAVIALGGWLLHRRSDARRRDTERRTADQRMLGSEFNAPPKAAPTRDQIFPQLRALTEQRRLADLPTIREYGDLLTQYVSDGVMRTQDPAFLPLKQRAIDAAVAFQQAFLIATAGNQADYRTPFQTGCALINGMDESMIQSFQRAVSALGESGAKVKPNAREINMFNQGRVDLSSMMLAKAAHKDGFAPELVVGLPSGGAHVATRVAATLGTIAGVTPVTWLTRPRTVKPERAGLMGSAEAPMVMDEEVALLRGKLGLTEGEHKAIRVLVVDDGQESGETLRLAVAQYTATFPGAVVRGAVTFGGAPLLQDTLSMLEGEDKHVVQKPNAGHYMTYTSYDAAGDRGSLSRATLDPPDKAATNSPGATMDTRVVIVTGGTSVSYAARDLLTNK